MKKYLYFPLIILSVLMALTGCSSDEENTSSSKGLVPLASADSWISDALTTQDQGYDPQVMVVIFSLDNLPVECSAEDLAAAFVGERCRYTANVQTYEGKEYGSIVMYRMESDGNKPLTFNIRYYSNKEKGYITSMPITFVSDETLGTLSAPANLSWNLE